MKKGENAAAPRSDRKTRVCARKRSPENALPQAGDNHHGAAESPQQTTTRDTRSTGKQLQVSFANGVENSDSATSDSERHHGDNAWDWRFGVETRREVRNRVRYTGWRYIQPAQAAGRDWPVEYTRPLYASAVALGAEQPEWPKSPSSGSRCAEPAWS